MRKKVLAEPRDLATRATSDAGAAHSPVEPHAPAPPSSEVAEHGDPPFVGRAAPLAALARVISSTREGRGTFALVTGEAGLGKTRLLAEMARRADNAGVRVMLLRCRGGGGTGPYRDALSVLAAQLRDRDAAAVAELVAPDGRALGFACPEMLDLPYLRSLPDLPDLSPDLNKFRVFSAVTAFLRNWSRREPLVLVLDDVQGADDGTVELTYYLQRNVVHGDTTFGERDAGGALTLVLARRPPDEGEAPLLERVLADARRGGPHLEIQLQRLAPDEIADLVAHMLACSDVPRDLQDVVEAESAGSPAVAVELVRSFLAEGLLQRTRDGWRFVGTHAGPTGRLADLLRRRLERTDASGRSLLATAAVVGGEFDPSLVAEAAGIDEDVRPTLLAQLQAARLVRPGASPRLAFAHEQLRQLLLDEMEPAERAARHLAVARALEGRPQATAVELARHHVAADNVEGALRCLPAAAVECRTAGNAAEAVSLLRRHVELFERLPREERQRRIGEVLAVRQDTAEILRRSGRVQEAVAAFQDLITAARGAADARAEARALVGLGNCANLAGDYAEARQVLQRALDLATACGEARAALEARIYLVQNAYMQGRFEQGEAHLAAVRKGLDGADRALRGEALRQIGLFEHLRGRSDEAMALYREALRLLTEVGDRQSTAATLHNLGILHNVRGEYHVARDCYERSLAIFREMGLRIEEAKCLTNMGNVHLQQGAATEAERHYLAAQALYRELKDRRAAAENLSNLGEADGKRGYHLRALERHRSALAVHRDLDNPAGIAFASYELAMTQLALGNLDEARAHVNEALQHDRSSDAPRALAYDLAASALLKHLEADDEGALAECRAALTQARRAGDRFNVTVLLGDEAALLLALGRHEEAHSSATQALLEATSLGAREAEVIALATLVTVAPPGESKGRLARMLELADRLENPAVGWRAWLAAARARRERGEHDAATAAVERALDLVAASARRLGDEAPGFLARRDVRAVVDELLTLEEHATVSARAGRASRAEALLARYHLLSSEEHRARARQTLAAALGNAGDAAETRRLKTFHDVVTTADARSLDGLLRGFVRKVLEQVDGERGLLFVLAGDDLSCLLGLRRDGEPLEAPERQVPREVVEWVLRERTTVVTEDAASSHHHSWTGSAAALHVKSLIAAPLLDGADAVGVIYVDRRATQARFGPQARADFQATCSDVARLVACARRADVREQEDRRLREDAAGAEGLPGLVGTSAVMRQLFATARLAASSNESVLITGQSGTGKEVLARALHGLGSRARKTFVAIDCGSVPASLMESVLFGHVKGAFTGADRDKAGLFEEANGGSLFLDEITNASRDFQARLLRVLQEREVRRVGGQGTIPVDVRILAATNLDLEAEVREGRFREDLFYRLNVIHLQLPPLAERREDIALLAERFLHGVVAREGKRLSGFTPEALRVLSAYAWPGNVRELSNCVARMAAFCTEGTVGAERIPERIRTTAGAGLDLRAARGVSDGIVQALVGGQSDFWTAVRDPLRDRSITRDQARQVIAEGLRRSGGSYKGAAALFGLAEDDYTRFMDFLRFNKLKLDFRPFRKPVEK